MTRKKLIRLSAPIALTYNWFFAPQFRVKLYANGFFLSTSIQIPNGAEGIRTPDLCLAKAAFSQLNYGPLLLLIQSQTRNLKSSINEWAFVDSNHRPSPYQRDALTN
jgi:hypothetical protein